MGDLLLSGLNLWFQAQPDLEAETWGSGFSSSICVTSSTHFMGFIPRFHRLALITARSHASGTNLVVQWLRLCAPKAGGSDSIPGN